MELLNNWWEEKRSAYLYAIMASHEKYDLHKQLFTDLQHAAEKQASIWEEKMKHNHLAIPASFKPDIRTRIVARLISLFGTDNLHYILSAMKIRGMSVF